MKLLKKVLDNCLAKWSKKIIKKYQPQVVAITGSVGKTSAREVVFDLLKSDLNVRQSKGNYNTEVGVPLTIMDMRSPGKNVLAWLAVWHKALKLIWGLDESYPEVLVLEMAADHPGDIKHLVKIARPRVAVVTAVSETHLEFFGSVEEVRQEKQVLVENTDSDGLVILNGDDPLVVEMAKSSPAKVISYGFSEGVDLRVSEFAYVFNEDEDECYLSFKLSYQGKDVTVKLKNALSKSHVYSFLAGLSVGIFYGKSLPSMLEQVKKFKPPKGRMNLLPGIKQTRLIDDTYNSSPRAVFAALETLSQVFARGKKIAVLGDMLELGSFTETAHLKVGEKCAHMAVDLLLTVGERAQDIAKGAVSAGMSESKIFGFADIERAGRFLQERMESGDLVLIKGSRGVHLEKVVKEVMAQPLRAKELLVEDVS